MRTRLPLGALIVAGVALAACASSSSSSSGKSPIAVNSPPAAFDGAAFTPAKHLPDVTLTDTAGRPWNLQFRGQNKVTVLYFGYTNCPDACPTDMAALGTAVRQLTPAQQQQVQIVFVTVDVKRDKAAVIRKWLDRFDKRIPPFVGLNGTESEITAAARGLGLSFNVSSTTEGLEAVEHSTQMTAFNQNGSSNLVWLDPPVPSDIAHDLRLLLDGASPV